jgi:hypothetical protein
MNANTLKNVVAGLEFAFNVAKEEGKGEGLFYHTVSAVLKNEGVVQEELNDCLKQLQDDGVIHKAFYDLKKVKFDEKTGRRIEKGTIYFKGPSTAASSDAKFLRTR